MAGAGPCPVRPAHHAAQAHLVLVFGVCGQAQHSRDGRARLAEIFEGEHN